MNTLNFLKEVKEGYGIDINGEIVRLGRWGEHKRWVINSINDKYLLKEKPYYLKANEFLFHIEFQKYVFKKGGPAVDIIYSNHENLREYELQSWVEGDHLSPAIAKDLIDLGKTIAHFSLISQEYKSKFDYDWKTPVYRNVHFPETLNEFLKRVELIQDSLLKVNNSKNKSYCNIVLLVHECFKNIEWHKLSQSYIHGDIHTYNSIRKSNDEIMIVDFDDARWGYTITDIFWPCAIASAIKWETENSEPKIHSKILKKNIKYILNGFLQLKKINSSEERSFPYILSLYIIIAFIQCTGIDEGKLPDDFETQVIKLNEILSESKKLNFDDFK